MAFCIFCLPITLATLNRSIETGFYCLVPDLSGKAFSFHHWEQCYPWTFCTWSLACGHIFLMCLFHWGSLSWKVEFFQMLLLLLNR
jgi:hypothetical protein